MKKVIKQKTLDILNRDASRWRDGWTFTIVNEAIKDANGDFDQLKSDLEGTRDDLNKVVSAIVNNRDEIEA